MLISKLNKTIEGFNLENKWPQNEHSKKMRLLRPEIYHNAKNSMNLVATSQSRAQKHFHFCLKIASVNAFYTLS